MYAYTYQVKIAGETGKVDSFHRSPVFSITSIMKTCYTEVPLF